MKFPMKICIPLILPVKFLTPLFGSSLRFDRLLPTMMGFLKNMDGIRPHIRHLCSCLRESSYFLIISINITSLSSSFVQTNFVSDDQGTKPNDSRNELSLQTLYMRNEINGSGGEDGVVLMFLGFPFSSRPYSSDPSSQDLFGCLGHIMMALIELWIRVEHWRSSIGLFRSKMSFHQALDLILKLNEMTVRCTRDMMRQRDCLDQFSKVPWVIPTFIVIEG
ncbi:hypothetical protein Tco_0215918 [Tanacetum coccineum]